MTKMRQTRYAVQGLTCNRCLVSAIDAVRALPGVRAVTMDLVPSGDSRIAVGPAGSATADQVRASLRKVGFELTL